MEVPLLLALLAEALKAKENRRDQSSRLLRQRADWWTCTSSLIRKGTLKTLFPELPSNLRWHFIGHLPKNKIRHALPLFELFHGIDSLELARDLNRIAVPVPRVKII